jgi:hypothetical protein
VRGVCVCVCVCVCLCVLKLHPREGRFTDDLFSDGGVPRHGEVEEIQGGYVARLLDDTDMWRMCLTCLVSERSSS